MKNCFDKLKSILVGSNIIMTGSYSDYILYGKEKKKYKDIDLIFRNDAHLLKYFPNAKIEKRTCIYSPDIYRRAVVKFEGKTLDLFIIENKIPYIIKDGIFHATLEHKKKSIEYALSRRMISVNKDKEKLNFYKEI